MAESLLRAGLRVEIVTYYNRDRPLANDQLPVFRAPHVPGDDDHTPGPKLYKIGADALLLREALRRHGQKPYDVIHGHHLEGALCGLALRLRARAPVIYDAHTLVQAETLSYGVFGRFPLSSALRGLQEICYRGADACIYAEAEIGAWAERRGIAPAISKVVPQGTSVKEVEAIADHVPTPFDGRAAEHVVYTGTLSRYQNVDALLHAAAQLRQRDTHFHIVTGESAASGAELEALARQLGITQRVSFVYDKGFAEHMRYVKFADAVVSPRDDCSGMPQKLTNYMVFGRKIVCSSGSAKLLDERTAYLYPRGDRSAFAAVLGAALDEPGNRRGEAARAAVQQLDWDRLTREVVEVYERALGLRGRHRPAPVA
jgi:glycosyltransferase involved in cell wall biosynthesis